MSRLESGHRLDSEKPMPPPVEITSVSGNNVRVTDEWLEDLVFIERAVVTNSVTDEQIQMVAIETEDGVCSWLRRLAPDYYVDTGIYEGMIDGTDDPDVTWNQAEDSMEAVQGELVLAVGLFPKYQLEAEWLSERDREYIRQMQAAVDDMDPDELAEKRGHFSYFIDPF